MSYAGLTNSAHKPSDHAETSSGPSTSTSTAVDFHDSDLRKFAYYQSLALDDCLRRIKSQEAVKGEYESLRSRLSTISDQTRYPAATIPLGPHALVRGELIHTNEILVFLGDNYFVERTAKQAEAIASRRIAKAQQNISELNEERNLLKSKLNMMTSLTHHQIYGGEAEIVEIREPAEEESVRSLGSEASSTSDEAISKRLDQLEAEEELGEEENQPDRDDDDYPKHLVPPMNARPRRSSLPSQVEKKQRKSVSFAPFDGPVPVRFSRTRLI